MSKIEKLIKELCPDGVEYKKMQDICDIFGGFTPQKNLSEYWKNENINWFKLEDIRQKGRVLKSSITKVDNNVLRIKKIFKANSIILSTTATIGEHAIVLEPFFCNQQFSIFTVKDKFVAKINPMFMFYYFFIFSKILKQRYENVNLPLIKKEELGNLLFPIPNISIQNQIVNILDKLACYCLLLLKILERRQ